MAESDDPMDPSAWRVVPAVCGSCIAWRPENPEPHDELAIGSCKLRPEMGRVPADLPKCSRYMQRGGFTYDPARHSAPTRRRSKTISITRRSKDGQEVHIERPRAEPPPRAPVPQNIDLGEGGSEPVVRQALVEMLREELGRSRRELAGKLKGGRVEVYDRDGLVRTVPATQFFSMLDRFASSLVELERFAESKRDKLDETAADIDDGLSRIRGTFTTFNVMFQHKEDYFTSK